MSKKPLTHEEYLKKLVENNKAYRNGEFELLDNILKINHKVLVKNKYGLCRPSFGDLVRGSVPSIKSAVDKNDYCVQEFIEKHGDTFDYSKVKYKTQKILVEIICREHSSFFQSPDAHKKGHGCIACAKAKNIKPKSEIIKRLEKQKRGFIYNFNSIKTLKDEIEITCKFGHIFNQIVRDHLNGNGCPFCANIQRDFQREGTLDNILEKMTNFLYIMKFYNHEEEFYKIGVSRDVKRRRGELKSDSIYNVEIIDYKDSTVSQNYILEDFFKKEFIDFKYIPKNIFPGYTECFSVNVWDLYESDLNYQEERHQENCRLWCEEHGLNYEHQFEYY